MKLLEQIASLSGIPGVGKVIVEALGDRAVSLAENEVTRYRNVEHELGRLKRTSERINALLTDAEERRYIEDESVKLWLGQLRSASFDTDNLLDEYQTALAVYNLQKSGSSRKRNWFQIELPSVSPEWGLIQRRRFASEIDKIDKRLDEIAKARKTLRLKGRDGVRRELPPCQRVRHFQTGPCQDPAAVIGRKLQKDEIVQLLCSDQRLTVPVVPIHGSAGIGKTTLARMIYDDDRIDEYFDFKAWVWLTDGCDVNNATKEIYKQMACQNGGLLAFDPLQNNLREHLKSRQGNKFLLVIDNLWADDFYFWETLRAPLLAGGDGSKVLITTRNEKICRIMHALSRPSLSGLNNDECWQLLESLALPQDVDEIDRDRKVTVGKEIANKCYGSPLAAKTLGTLLNGTTEEEWCDVLSEMRALKDDQSGVLVTLKISYHHLPYHIKQCFAYCSIFPNGYKFERDQVIRYWMAEGLLRSEGRRRPEAIGMKYFDELLWRSFFEKIPDCDKSRVERYRMPSLMYDLARLVSKYEFRGLESGFVFSESEGSHCEQARYASLLHRESKPQIKFESIEQYPNLRTLKVCDEWGERIVPLNPIKAQSFHKCVNLRVLDLSNSNLKCLPDSVSELIHLRYLGLSNTEIVSVPEKTCDLFNLQTLELKCCSKLTGLPEGLHRLIKLRHVDMHLDWKVITSSTEVAIPQGIGELEHLQTLSRFNVTSNAKGQDCNINELKDLNLRGELCILNLERVPASKPEDARDANLRGKAFIENLMLGWHESAHSDRAQWQNSKKVLQYLQPNNRLRKLWLINFPGTSFPDWMGDASFSSLETIRISNCNNFNFLPLLGKLPRLKNLSIDNVNARTMDTFVGFPSLEHLILSNLHSLERLSLENEIPKLTKIYVEDCPYLKELVIHQNFRDKFEIRNCPNWSED